MHFQACCSLLLFWSSICWEKQQGCLEQKSSVPVLLLNRITVHCIQFLIQHHYPLCTNSAAINAHALSFKQAALHESVARFAAVHLLLSLSLSLPLPSLTCLTCLTSASYPSSLSHSIVLSAPSPWPIAALLPYSARALPPTPQSPAEGLQFTQEAHGTFRHTLNYSNR